MDEENRDNVAEAKEKISQAKKETEQITKAATKFAVGDYAGAIKEALKSDIVKKRIKKALIGIAIKLFIPVMVVVILASSVFSVFNRIKKEFSRKLSKLLSLLTQRSTIWGYQVILLASNYEITIYLFHNLYLYFHLFTIPSLFFPRITVLLFIYRQLYASNLCLINNYGGSYSRI